MANEEKKKILIFENQYYEYNKLCKKLREQYEVVIAKELDCNRTQEKFKLFADRIRIWVNDNYDINYRNKALDYILEVIGTKAGDKIVPHPVLELIIMDHILGGSHGCLTGIDLAEKLAKKIEIDKMPPILFLSKTEHTDKNRLYKYEEYKRFIKEQYRAANIKLTEDELAKKVNAHTDWVHKGYFGDEILQSKYIRKYVIKDGIEKLLKTSKTVKFSDTLSRIIDFYETQNSKTSKQSNHLEKFKEIKNEISTPSDEQMNKIDEYKQSLLTIRSPILDATDVLNLFS